MSMYCINVRVCSRASSICSRKFGNVQWIVMKLNRRFLKGFAGRWDLTHSHESFQGPNMTAKSWYPKKDDRGVPEAPMSEVTSERVEI